MFTGRQPRKSSNVRVMQIFHELKPQFPTIPDHIITSCITSYLTNHYDKSHASKNPAHESRTLIDLIETACRSGGTQMGRPLLDTPTSLANTPVSLTTTPQQTPLHADVLPVPPPRQGNSNERHRSEMNEALTTNNNIEKGSVSVAKRPNTLDIRTDRNDFGNTSTRKLQLSEKCRNVHKLLNSPNISEKPPRSPLSAKRLLAKHSPTTANNKKETVSTPTQTTDTLVNNCPSPTSVNLSLNVNCQMGLVQSPTTRPKCSTSLQVTPSQPWLNPAPSNDATSPRSFTSVNLTLRPPTSTPQDPIDITSQNSSLTYSTSSFDRENGLHSRLQITLGSGGGSVSSVRARPRSSCMSGESPPEMPARAGSLNNLSSVSSEPPVLLKQQARIERMRIELRTEKAKLVIMRQEVAELEKKMPPAEKKTDDEVEKQLLLEIKHLRCQCEQLALADKEFYDDIYTGPQGPLIAGDLPNINPRVIRRQARRLQYQGPQLRPFESAENHKWSCSLCTFLNHPDLNKCEQCEMARGLHGTQAGTTDSNTAIEMLQRSMSANNASVLSNSSNSTNFTDVGAGNAARSISLDSNFLRRQDSAVGVTSVALLYDPNIIARLGNTPNANNSNDSNFPRRQDNAVGTSHVPLSYGPSVTGRLGNTSEPNNVPPNANSAVEARVVPSRANGNRKKPAVKLLNTVSNVIKILEDNPVKLISLLPSPISSHKTDQPSTSSDAASANAETLSMLEQSAITLRSFNDSRLSNEDTAPIVNIFDRRSGTVEVVNPNLIVFNTNRRAPPTPTSDASGVASSENCLDNMLEQTADSFRSFNMNDVPINPSNNFNNINTIECVTNNNDNGSGFVLPPRNMFNLFKPSYTSTGIKSQGKQ